MKAIEEINALVKSAQYAPPAYPYKKTGDPELDEIFRQRYFNSDAYKRYSRNRQYSTQKRLVNDRQLPAGRTTMPGAGRSWGSGYTGNEIRHGGAYATPQGAKPQSYVGNYFGKNWYDDGSGIPKSHDQLDSTQMMQKWMNAGTSGKDSKQWKDYANKSKQDAESYLPNNRPQYTYAGYLRTNNQQNQRMYGSGRQMAGGSSELGSRNNGVGAKGTHTCPACNGRGTV